MVEQTDVLVDVFEDIEEQDDVGEKAVVFDGFEAVEEAAPGQFGLGGELGDLEIGEGGVDAEKFQVGKGLGKVSDDEGVATADVEDSLRCGDGTGDHLAEESLDNGEAGEFPGMACGTGEGLMNAEFFYIHGRKGR